MNDRLSEIFMTLLGDAQDPQETAANLIRRAACAYAVEIMNSGDIPYAFIQDVVADLEAEVLEMYRKTTYGFLTLAEYRESRQAKKRSKKLPRARAAKS